MFNHTFVFSGENDSGAGWVPLETGLTPTPSAFTVLSRTYGVTVPFDGTDTRVGAAQVGDSFTPSAPNPTEPNGLFTIATNYAMSADLAQIVPARMVDETAATVAAVVSAALRVASLAYHFDGAAFVRTLGGSAANLATLAPNGASLAAAPGEWAINHTPAANTVATITRANVAGQRHVCRSITVTLIGLAASAEATVLVNLRDGATGAGAILWSARLLVAGVVGTQAGITLSNLNIVGSVNTAMTLEFAAAGGANTFETVALTGYTAA